MPNRNDQLVASMKAWVADPLNADEELTYRDALAKWGISQKQLENAVFKLRRKGLIETPKLIRAAR